MRKKVNTRRMISVLLLLCMILSNSATAFAIDIDEKDQTCMEMPAGLSCDAAITRVEKDGTIKTIPLDIKAITEEIPGPNPQQSDSNLEGKYMKTTVTTTYASPKKNETSDTNDNQKLYVVGTLTIFWRDNFGPSNDFLGISGGWAPLEDPATGQYATLSNGMVKFRGKGMTATSVGEIVVDYPDSNPFSIGQDRYENGWWAYEATSYVHLKLGDVSDTLRVHVSTGQIG